MNYKHLTEKERYYINVRKSSGDSLHKIAKDLQRSPSTISREVNRNTKKKGKVISPLKLFIIYLFFCFLLFFIFIFEFVKRVFNFWNKYSIFSTYKYRKFFFSLVIKEKYCVTTCIAKS